MLPVVQPCASFVTKFQAMAESNPVAVVRTCCSDVAALVADPAAFVALCAALD